MSWWGNDNTIRFPNLGIEFPNLPRGFAIGTFTIAFYGVVIAIGMLAGLAMARWKAKKTGQDAEIYLDCALWAIPLSVIGTRIYEVIFNWEDYGWDFWKIINIREGGLAIYGGIIAAILTVFTYCRIKKLRFTLLADTAILGMILGQIIGRWGNFFNREAFGKYTDGLFAMQIDVRYLGNSFYGGTEAYISEIQNNIVTVGENSYIQVHPTFLYESLWNVLIFCIMLWAWPRKKFNGEIILIYLSGYGFGRFFLEGLRIDQLQLGSTGLAVSQVLSGIVFVAAFSLLIFFRIRSVKLGIPVSLELRLNPADAKKAKSSDKNAEEAEEKSEETEETVEDKSEDAETGQKPDEAEPGGEEPDKEEPQVEKEATETVPEESKEAPEEAENTEKEDENASQGSEVEEDDKKPE